MKDRIKNLLFKMKFGVLATKGSEYPYASLLAYCADDDLKEIYFATYKNTTKYRNIKEDPYVTFLIFDLGKNPVEDGESLTAIGEVKETQDQSAIKKFLEVHPDFESFIINDNCSLLKLIVKKYILVNKIQNAKIFENE